MSQEVPLMETTGRERVAQHLEAVKAAALADITFTRAEQLLVKSIDRLLEESRKDPSIDRYAEAGGNPVGATRGQLVSSSSMRIGAKEHEEAVAWLTERGWIAPLRIGSGRKSVVTYSFAIGSP